MNECGTSLGPCYPDNECYNNVGAFTCGCPVKHVEVNKYTTADPGRKICVGR